MFKRTCLFGHALILALGCGRTEPAPAAAPAASAVAPELTEAAEERRRAEEAAHRVVFADRISFGYLLLLPGPPGPAPERAELQAIARRVFLKGSSKKAQPEDGEVGLMLDLVATPPRADLGGMPVPGGAKDLAEVPADPEAAARVWATSDLLGLEIEALPAAAIEAKLLADPELARALTPEERAGLPQRNRVVLVRALYRNQHGVRGLRLLQGLVRALASEMGALVHDPDTMETMGPEVFAARRLQRSLGNLADQVAVVPFVDPGQPDRVRLTTRGMRRFGSVDLELDGLRRDLASLQQATYFLHGLGLVMVRLGEFDVSGFAVEAPELIDLHYRDCAEAYAGQNVVPRCADCPEQAQLHLVERPPEPHDPPGHVVARVVRPRGGSGQAEAHDSWVQAALDRVLGRPTS